MNLLWVAAIAIAVLVEKVVPRGDLVGRLAGVALAVAGVVFVARGVMGLTARGASPGRGREASTDGGRWLSHSSDTVSGETAVNCLVSCSFDPPPRPRYRRRT
jgi:hypothetical protein